jgi:hypothetical protein
LQLVLATVSGAALSPNHSSLLELVDESYDAAGE